MTFVAALGLCACGAAQQPQTAGQDRTEASTAAPEAPGLTGHMALDYAEYGIRINTICPGLILSDNMEDEIRTYPEGPEREAFMKLLEGMQPLPPGQMADVANAALFLASPMSAYTTGAVIMVDGGASIKAH